MEKHSISLVIPAYNEEKYIGTCLEHAIKYNNSAFQEIIVIDNASTDRTKEIASTYPQVKVFTENNKGVQYARQRGLNEAHGDIVAYIDADTRMHETWAPMILESFAKNQKQVCISGPYKYYDASTVTKIILFMCWWISAPLVSHMVGYSVLGGNFAAKRSALLTIGGFDTSIKFYGDDTNIARRLHPMGHVNFRMNFYIYSSCRRFKKEGLIRTNFNYVMNFIWQVVFHRSFSNNEYTPSN